MPELDPRRLAEIEAQEKSAELDQHICWESVSKTHVGRVRYQNEDAYFNSEEQTLWAVADGMGGHSRGSFASAAVVKALGNFAKQPSLLQNLDSFEGLIESAHDKCLNTFKHKRVGTTVAALFAYGRSCFCLWAGDSRIYRVRDDQLVQLTRDHTVAEEKVAQGQLSAEEACDHPSAHVLTRAVGAHKTISLEIGFNDVVPGDRYLICSDGLYNGLTNEFLCECMTMPLEAGLSALIDKALDLGGRDNMTGIVLEAR